MSTVIKQCFKRELLSIKRQPGRWLNPILFFLLVITLFAIALGGDAKQISFIAAPVIWVSVLLSCFLSAESLYQQDYQDGSLKQYLFWPLELSFIVLIKYVVHWLFYVLPLVLLTPLACVMLSLPQSEITILFCIILIAMSVLLGLTVLIAALTIGMNQASALLALLIMPFYIPVLILGNLWFNAAIAGLSTLPYIALFVAMLLLTLLWCPLGAAFLVKLSMEN